MCRSFSPHVTRNQSVRDLSKQGTLNGKFESQDRLERVHDGEYSGILTVKAKRVFAKRSAQVW